MSRRRGLRNLGGALTRRTLVWVAVVVVLLVVVDVVLVALALARTAPAQNGTPGPVPTFSSSPRPSTTASATASPTDTADTAGIVTPGRRLLSAVDGQEAWRASGGSCDGTDGVLEHSVDGGASWTRVGLGDERGALLALRADGAGISVLVGSGPACATTVLTSTDDGVTWHDGAAGAAGAGIGPNGLILSSGTAEVPCPDPVQAFRGEQTTAVVCDGGLEWRADSADWVSVPIRGVRSLAVNGTAYTLARSGASDCSGVQIASMPATGLTASTAVTSVGCAAEAEGDAALVLARAGTAVWLWAGDDVMVSEDGGVTW